MVDLTLIGLIIGIVSVGLGVLAYLRRGKPPGLGFFDWLEIRRRVREAKDVAYVQWMDEWMEAIKQGEGREFSPTRLREILDERLAMIYENQREKENRKG